MFFIYYFLYIANVHHQKNQVATIQLPANLHQNIYESQTCERKTYRRYTYNYKYTIYMSVYDGIRKNYNILTY